MCVFMRRELRVNTRFRDWQYLPFCLCIYGYAYTFASASVCACVRVCVRACHQFTSLYAAMMGLAIYCFSYRKISHIFQHFFSTRAAFLNFIFLSLSLNLPFSFLFLLQECHLAKFKIYGKKSWPTWKKLVWQQPQP